ncbi:hypothetical protein [Sphingobium chungbukense]|uniref:Conjugal transfer protein TraN n=1 Tax=Sphingobium chungbukense TaxID=56193 RepID=A0A0M3AJ88_9SPHN|nr:hypothetical protein [Sphingobium chungbukense]KKW90157.1 hypothetical protein YP76_22260 [Sphingobium chungbukense]
MSVPALWVATSAPAQTVEDRARGAADASRGKTSDSDTLQGTYLTPGLAGQPITTVDGSKSFNPSIACQKTSTLLELLAQPGSTGDLTTLRISRDRNMDGGFDETLNVPVPVSGICANGLVSCEPGSWNGCRAFRWDTNPAGDLALNEVGLTQLAGCYCINNSCGTNLAWANMASVLKDLGGGVIGTLTTADSRLGVAQAAIDGPVIRYTGAQTTACTSEPNLAVTAYRDNPSALGGAAFAASAGNSVFQSLVASPAGIGKAATSRTCTIKRDVTIREVRPDDVIQLTSGGYSAFTESADSLIFQVGAPWDNSLYGGGCGMFDFRMTLHIDDATRLRDVRVASLAFDDWVQIRVDGKVVMSDPGGWTGDGYPPGGCERNANWYSAPNFDLKPWLTNGDHEIWLRVAVGDKGEALATIRAIVDTSCDIQESVADSCMGNAGDPSCSLEDELIDGVQTFRNGVGTGLRPLPQTRAIGPGTCRTNMTRDFWQKDRRYQCTASIAPPSLERSAYIIDHSTETLLADRQKKADGTVSTSTRSFALPDRGTVNACEAICKTRAPKANSDVAVDGVVGERQNSPSGWDTFYHACNASNVCPLGPDEELVTGCGCLDDFPEAIVMMQTVRLGGADLICTATAR